MSGHNRWAKVKHVKAKTDAIKGKVFTKVIKDLVMAAKSGGGDPGLNASLRTAMQKAKEVNMPQSTVKNAIMRGTGELPGVNYDELTYEAYGPGGTAIIIDVLTDNKNKAVAEVRYIVDRNGGKMAEAGAVSYMFKKKAVLIVGADKVTEDKLMEIVLDAGADDVKQDEDIFEITGEPNTLEPIRAALEKAGLEVQSAEVSKVPDTSVMVAGEDARKIFKLIDALEEYDDVQNVYSNYDMDEKTMQEAMA